MLHPQPVSQNFICCNLHVNKVELETNLQPWKIDKNPPSKSVGIRFLVQLFFSFSELIQWRWELRQPQTPR